MHASDETDDTDFGSGSGRNVIDYFIHFDSIRGAPGFQNAQLPPAKGFLLALRTDWEALNLKPRRPYHVGCSYR